MSSAGQAFDRSIICWAMKPIMSRQQMGIGDSLSPAHLGGSFPSEHMLAVATASSIYLGCGRRSPSAIASKMADLGSVLAHAGRQGRRVVAAFIGTAFVVRRDGGATGEPPQGANRWCRDTILVASFHEASE
jgi:hypothetical protein